LAHFRRLGIGTKSDMRQGVQRRFPGLLNRHGATTPERQSPLGDAPASGSGPVFENKGFATGRHDANAKSFHVVVECNKHFVARCQGINRAFGELCHVAVFCRHRVATKKETKYIYGNANTQLRSEISMYYTFT